MSRRDAMLDRAASRRLFCFGMLFWRPRPAKARHAFNAKAVCDHCRPGHERSSETCLSQALTLPPRRLTREITRNLRIRPGSSYPCMPHAFFLGLAVKTFRQPLARVAPPLSSTLGIHGNKHATSQIVCALAVPDSRRVYCRFVHRCSDWHWDLCLVKRAGADQVAVPGDSARNDLAGSAWVFSCSSTFVRARILAFCISEGIQLVRFDINCRVAILTRQGEPGKKFRAGD